MSVPCEIAVKCVLPVVRAMIARELISEHNLNQTEVADLLGVSQPAISLYSRNVRGKAIDLKNDEDTKKLVENVAISLAKSRPSREEITLVYCRICRVVRAKGLLCELHKQFDAAIDLEQCQLCRDFKNAACIKNT